MLTTGDHHPRYRVVRIRFECRVRTAKSPARGPEWTDPHQKASPAIANARPCIMIVGRRYETEDAGANSRFLRPSAERDDGREGGGYDHRLHVPLHRIVHRLASSPYSGARDRSVRGGGREEPRAPGERNRFNEDAGRATSASIGPEVGTDRGPTQRMIPTRRGTTRVVDSSPTRSPGLNSKNTELSLSSQARPMPRLNVGPLSVSMSPNGTYAPMPPSA